MPHRTPNADALAYNAAWKRQQMKQQAPQQNANKGPRQAPLKVEKPPVMQQGTPKANGETPEECRNCTLAKECKKIMRLWYQHTPRPELVRAWVQLVDEHAEEMVCLSGLRVVSP
jgi:hypothetical protein